MNLLQQMALLVQQVAQLVSTIASKQHDFSGIESRLECICERLEQSGGNVPYPPPPSPNPDPEPPPLPSPQPPPGGNAPSGWTCAAEKAIADSLRTRLGGLSRIVADGRSALSDVGEALTVFEFGLWGVAGAALAVKATAIVSVFTVLLAVLAAFGWGAARWLNSLAEHIRLDIFDGILCGYVDIGTGGEVIVTDIAHVESEFKMAINAANFGFNRLELEFVRSLIWDTLIQQIVSGTIELDGVVQWVDLTQYYDVSDCPCEDIVVPVPFGFFGDDGSVLGCDDVQFDRWEFWPEQSPLPQANRFVDGVQCSTGSTLARLLGNSAIAIRPTSDTSAGMRTQFYASEGASGTITCNSIGGGFGGTNQMFLTDENNNTLDQVTWDGSGTNSGQMVVENLEEGMYYVRLRTNASANSSECIRLEFVPSV